MLVLALGARRVHRLWQVRAAIILVHFLVDREVLPPPGLGDAGEHRHQAPTPAPAPPTTSLPAPSRPAGTATAGSGNGASVPRLLTFAAGERCPQCPLCSAACAPPSRAHVRTRAHTRPPTRAQTGVGGARCCTHMHLHIRMQNNCPQAWEPHNRNGKRKVLGCHHAAVHVLSPHCGQHRGPERRKRYDKLCTIARPPVVGLPGAPRLVAQRRAVLFEEGRAEPSAARARAVLLLRLFGVRCAPRRLRPYNRGSEL